MAHAVVTVSGRKIIAASFRIFWSNRGTAVLLFGMVSAILAVLGLVPQLQSSGGSEFGIALLSYYWFQKVHTGNWPAKIEFRNVWYVLWTRLKLIVPLLIPAIGYAVIFYNKSLGFADVALLAAWLLLSIWLFQRCCLAFPVAAMGGRMKLRQAFKITRGSETAWLVISLYLLAVIFCLVLAVTLLPRDNPFIFAVVNAVTGFIGLAVAYSINSAIYQVYSVVISSDEDAQ